MDDKETPVNRDPAYSDFNLPIDDDAEFFRALIESATPSQDDMERLAKLYPPPAEWMAEEEDCPF